MGTLVLLCLVFLFIALYFGKLVIYGAEAEPAQGSITITASGEAKAVPDIATFSFAADQTGKDVNEAQSKMSAIANKAVDFVKSKGVDPKDIQTSDYSANPQYDYTDGKQVLTGYEARENITVKVRDTSKAGDILSGIGGLGVSEISNLSFESDDPDTLQQQAIDDAINNAKNKAAHLSSEAGFKIGRLIGFSEDAESTPPGPTPLFDKAAMSATPVVSPEIQTGQNTVTASVTLTYEIK